MSFACPYCATTPSREHNFRTHLMGTAAYGGHDLSRAEADRIVAGGHISARPTISAAPVQALQPADDSPVRAGHVRSLELLERTNEAVQTREAYEAAIGHPVYLRPTDGGLTVISLDPATASMVGVGGRDSREHLLTRLPPTPAGLQQAVYGYRQKVETLGRASDEERFALACIRTALVNGLRLRSDLIFLHQEWRFPDGGKLDLLAVDPANGQLVVIELKKSAQAGQMRNRDGLDAEGQAQKYAAHLYRYRTSFQPFAVRLLGAMARIHAQEAGLDGLLVELSREPRTEVWWPGHPRAPSSVL